MSGDPKLRVRAMYGEAECYAGLYQFEEAIKTLRAIKDESEQADISRRIADLEQQKREAAQARSGLQTIEAKRATKSQNTNAPATEPAAQNKNAASRKTRNKGEVNSTNRNASVGQNKNETARKFGNRKTANANEKKNQRKPSS